MGSSFNVPDAYNDVWWKLASHSIEEDTRNGRVKVYPKPFLMTIEKPEERVLFDRKRDCNHFFHLAEVVWMFSGSDDVRFLEYYNSQMRSFAEPNSDIVWGAYGRRWIANWREENDYGGYAPYDQISRIIGMLKRDPTTRRAVLSMWDSFQDLTAVRNDLPCNTHIYFRVIHGGLDMTVCNRSNDLIWGMLGANAVHMTYLHELIAHETGIPVRCYHVMTNNLHIYERHWGLQPAGSFDFYSEMGPHIKHNVEPYPLLQGDETWEMLREDCRTIVGMTGEAFLPNTRWIQDVVLPILMAYRERKEGGDGLRRIAECKATDWRLACEMYAENKDGSL